MRFLSSRHFYLWRQANQLTTNSPKETGRVKMANTTAMPNLMADVAEVDVAAVTVVEVVPAVAMAEAAASHHETLHPNLSCPLSSEGGVGGC
jgi:hypothetical protein